MGKWWNDEQEEPQKPNDSDAEQEIHAYNGPWTEQFFKVVVYMNVTPPGGGNPFSARYTVIIADYNMTAFTDTLNKNSVVYTVIPLEPGAGGEIE